MTLKQSHRGPDGIGFMGVDTAGNTFNWINPGEVRCNLKVGLGHTRFSILDLSLAAHQPMVTEDKRYALSFNGLIYNYLELKEKIHSSRFRSSGDTEVLLKLMAQNGKDALNEINGIFAFAFYDLVKKRMFLVRDPLGIKPLYYFKDERGIFFASEIRALIEVQEKKPAMNLPLVSRYLISNWIPDPDTLFEGILKLEPGHFLEILPNGEIFKKCYFDFRFNLDESHSETYWLEKLEKAFESSVSQQLRSDVPIAFFLSGGLDSSILAAQAKKIQKASPSTFTIGFKWTRLKEDDLDIRSARLLKNHFGFDYHEVMLEPTVLNLLPQVIECLEEPISDPAAVCSFLICKAASSRFKVLISGQGGDEMFGGYSYYRGGQIARHLMNLPSMLTDIADYSSAWLPYSVRGKRLQSVHRMKRFLFSLKHSWPEPFLIFRSAMTRTNVTQLLNNDVLSLQAPPFERHFEHFEKVKHLDPLHQMMYLDIKTYLPNLNLAYTDKTSMSQPVEVRVPFLDQSIIQLIQELPSRYKVGYWGAKRLLKTFSEKLLPREIIYRKKTGFGFPIRDWLKENDGFLREILLSSSNKTLFETKTIEKWIKEHEEMKADHTSKLYNLMTFSIWKQKFEVGIS